MKITTVRALPGPNIYVARPVLVAGIELEDLTEKESTDIPGFTDRLLALLPGLHDHHCAKGAPGGFIERLHGGTYFGHIVEHTALELCGLGGSPGFFGRTVYAGAPGHYQIIMEYRNESAAEFLLRTAADLVQALVCDQPFSLEAPLAEARRVVAETDLGPSTRAIVDAAEARGIPWYRLTHGNLVQLGHGKWRQLISATQSERTSIIGVEVAGDKALTKEMLDAAFIPVPRGVVVRSAEEALAALASLSPPLVVKPLDGHQGKGVSLRVQTEDEVRLAFEEAARISRSVVVEEFFAGSDYRVLVVDGKMVAASERLPAQVIGDGVHTLAELVAIANQDPRRGDGHENVLTKIVLDDVTHACLGRRGWKLDQVPAPGEVVVIRDTANLSTGGTACDVTDEIHPAVTRLCERAARLVGLDICGVDLITPDITKPLPEVGAGVVEVNAAPGIRMHVHPSEGKPRDAGAAIVNMLYPEGNNGRIPIVAITGTNGKTTVTRMIGHILSDTGRRVGMTTTDGVWIDGHEVAHGDMTGFQSSRTVLSDSSVEVAVLETARGGIVRRSLGYDWSDVGILTNIQPDHLGQDGIETIDDLLHIKSLVAERVREDGTLVLNADDERLAKLPENPRIRKVPRQVVFFAQSEDNSVVRRHLTSGGTAYFRRGDWLIEAEGRHEHPLVRASTLPVTLGGLAPFQVGNVLAAAAACRALGVKRGHVADALAGFRSGENNQGRMNLYRVGRGYVIVDYGHNPGAFVALCDLISAWNDRRVTGIFTAPGDRSDDTIQDLGRQAARCFDRLIIREDSDLRGRRPYEVAELICQAALAEAPTKECRIVPQEAEALRSALEELEEGEVVVFFYEKHTEPSLGVLRSFGAESVDAIEPMRTRQIA